MITKRFNYILRQFKKTSNLLNFSIQKTSEQPNIKNYQNNQSQRILKLALDDIQQKNFKNYKYIKTFLEKQFLSSPNIFSVNKNNEKANQNSKNYVIQQQLLRVASQYPLLKLTNQAIYGFYKNVVNENIHHKENEFLQKCLMLAIIFDPNINTSSLYIEYSKFYIKNNVQIIKALFSINLVKQNVINTVKLFLFRVFQRGFLPRRPYYSRSLYIVQPIKLLKLMVSHKSLNSNLMIKKVSFDIFSQIKQFYQFQMKQNLYHNKKILLLEQKLIPIIPVMFKSWQLKVQKVQNQMKFLRQLYIKIFLVIQKPNFKNTIFFYDRIKNNYLNILNQNQQSNKNISLLEKLVLKQQRQIFFQYLKKVQTQFQSFQYILIHQKQQNIKKILKNFDNEELLYILLNFSNLKLNTIIINIISKQLSIRISPIQLKNFIKQIIIFFRKVQSNRQILQSISSFLNVFYNQDFYEQLDLNQMTQLSAQQFVFLNNKIKETLIKIVLKKDIRQIEIIQILCLLKLYINTNYSKNEQRDIQTIKNLQKQVHNKNRQAVIYFVLRFLSDQHDKLPFNQQFENILILIYWGNEKAQCQSIQQNLIHKNFNDQQNNYPAPILEELKSFIKKNLWKIKNKKLYTELKKYYFL